MKIYFIRHGQTQGNKEKRLIGRSIDLPLIEFGIKQSEALCKQLKNKEIQLMRISPLCRTKQTGEILANHLHVKHILYEDNLIERNFTIFEGLDSELLKIKKREYGICGGELYNYFPNDIGGVENNYNVHKRIRELLLKDLTEQPPNANIIYLTHAGVIHSFMNTELGIKEDKVHAFKIKEASYFMCEVDKYGNCQIMELWNNNFQ